MTLPKRAITLTDEKWDRLVTLLHTYCKTDPDADIIAHDILSQQFYNPADVPIKFGYALLPERRKLLTTEEENHIKELQGTK